MRYAVKVAYEGARFSGSQVQPGLRTVHSEVARALAALGGPPEPRLLWAGRTDRGVSAAGNVVVLETEHPAASLLPSLTFRMEDVWAWALAPVGEGFEPRHAARRRYRYHLRSDLDAKAMEAAMAPFVGEHDFTAFCRLEPGVNPVRRVDAVRAGRRGAFLLVDVEGPSFLWNQVRRMVEAGRRVAEGELAEKEVRRALDEGKPADLGTAAPEPLVLMDVEYDGLRFEAAEPSLRGRLFSTLRRRQEARGLELAVGDALLGEDAA